MGGISEVLSPDVTAQVRELLAGALDGRVVFDGRGGWKIMLFLNAKGEVELEHFQPDPDGTYKFFSYSTAGSSYGAGKILQEPDLSILPKPFDDETPIAGALVVDDSGTLVGILDFKSILKVLIPEVAGGLTAKLEALGVSIAFAQADSADLDETRLGFRARVIKNADTRVKDVMLAIRGIIDAEADLLEALKLIYNNKITVLPVYEGKKLIGVVRDSDLFLTVDILME